MAADVEHVIDAAGDPVIAVFITARAVAREVVTGIGPEIGIDETRMVTVDRAHLPRPRTLDHQRAFGGAVEQLAGGKIDDPGHDTEKRPAGRAGLECGRTRQGRDENAAGFCLPPGIDDRAAALADRVVIPLPGLGVDWFADGAQELQTLARSLLHRRLALAHQRADRGRCGVKDIDLVFVDHFPEARSGRVVRHAFEHQRDRAIGERTVDYIGMPRHPADVGRAPVDVTIVIIKGV